MFTWPVQGWVEDRPRVSCRLRVADGCRATHARMRVGNSGERLQGCRNVVFRKQAMIRARQGTGLGFLHRCTLSRGGHRTLTCWLTSSGRTKTSTDWWTRSEGGHLVASVAAATALPPAFSRSLRGRDLGRQHGVFQIRRTGLYAWHARSPRSHPVRPRGSSYMHHRAF